MGGGGAGGVLFAQRKSKSSSNPLGFQKPCPNPEIARNLSVVRDRKPSSNQLEQKGMFICSRNVKMSWFQEWWYPGAQIMSPSCFSSHPSSVILNDIYLVVANPPLQGSTYVFSSPDGKRFPFLFVPRKLPGLLWICQPCSHVHP